MKTEVVYISESAVTGFGTYVITLSYEKEGTKRWKMQRYWVCWPFAFLPLFSFWTLHQDLTYFNMVYIYFHSRHKFSSFSIYYKHYLIINMLRATAFRFMGMKQGCTCAGYIVNSSQYVRFEVLTVNGTIVWDMALGNLIEFYGHFGGSYCHSFQRRRVRRATSKQSSLFG